MEQNDDISSEWATLQGKQAVPVERSVSPEDVDLQADLLDLTTHPEFIYRVRDGYSINDLAIIELHCHGGKRASMAGAGPRKHECWIYSFSRCIFSIEPFDVSKNYSRPRYRSPKKEFTATLEEAIAQFHQKREQHLRSIQERIVYERTCIAEREQGIVFLQKLTKLGESLQQLSSNSMNTLLIG